MASSLRSRVIRLAASTADGSPLRRMLLAILDDSTDTSPTDWGTMLRMLREKPKLDEEAAAAESGARQLNLLKRLEAGDRVEITYHDTMRGGKVKTIREVSMSWATLKERHPGSFNDPQVLLKAKVPGKFKEGTIRVDRYGDGTQLTWQGTMMMEVRAVLDLRKV